MVDYIGKRVVIKTEEGTVQGKLTYFNRDSGKLTVEDSYNISNELDLVDIIEVKLADVHADQLRGSTSTQVLTEENMYSLFYDAFNVYGPFEDHFSCTIATSLKKFLRDLANSRIKIIIGSDDVFGRVGLCFARILLDKVEHLDVVLECDISDLRTLKYKNSFINSGGSFAECPSPASYTMILFACNREFEFTLEDSASSLVLLLDIPKQMPFAFTGLGLGFTPENYRTCPKFYYLIDAGFGNMLCDKYGICKQYKSSLMKVEITK